MDPVKGSWLQGALVAGASATASTASIAAINSGMNADGDIFKQLKTISKDAYDATTSKESVQNIIIAMASAGLTVGASNYISTGSFTTPATATNTISNNANAFERITANIKNSIGEVALQTTISSATQSAISGESFTNSLQSQVKNIIIYSIAKAAANEIGRLSHETDISEITLGSNEGIDLANDPTKISITTAQSSIGKPLQLTLHAGLGAIIAALTDTNITSGAIAGVVGELAAEGAIKAGIDRNGAINIAALSGALSSAVYGNLMELDDGEIGKNVWEGSRVGRNAGENNALYVSKENQKVIATDGIDDNKVIIIDEKEANILINKNKLLLFQERFADDLSQQDPSNYYANTNINFENYMNDDAITDGYFTGPDRAVAVISPNYQNQTNGQVYSLDNKEDFYQLSLLTGQYGMEYSREISDILFGDYNDMTKIGMNYTNENYLSNDLNNDFINNNSLLKLANDYNNDINYTNNPNNMASNNINTNIFFQNGMFNNYISAINSAGLVSSSTNRPTGLIVNNTGNQYGNPVNDVTEYMPRHLVLRDILNGEIYQQIDNYNLENNQRSLVITHSAGNNDIVKGSQALQLSNIRLNNTIDVMSVGSPLSNSTMRNELDPAGINLVGSYNNWKDPVTHSKTWGVGALGLFGAGFAYGATVGIGSTITGSGLEAFASGLIGGGIGGGAIIGGLKLQHPFERYYNKNFNNIQTDIKNWSEQNPIAP